MKERRYKIIFWLKAEKRRKSKMRYAQNLSEISTIADTIFIFTKPGCQFRSALIVRAGNIFIDSQFNNRPAEVFLRRFLQPGNGLLTMAIEHLHGDRAVALSSEIKENCCAFLFMGRKKIQDETLAVLRSVRKNPPHENFNQAVKNKIKALKLN